MTHYSEKPNSVRVDFFKPSGKWYETEALYWDNDLYDEKILIHKAFRKALFRHVGQRYKGMQAICLEPYHPNAHPISLFWDGIEEE